MSKSIKLVPSTYYLESCSTYFAYYGDIAIGDIEKADDGYFAYVPLKTISRDCFWSQEFLRALADKLEEMNKERDAEVSKLMEITREDHQ